MRAFAFFGVGVVALCALSDTHAAALLGASVTVNNFRASAIYLPTGSVQAMSENGRVSSFSELPMWQGLQAYQSGSPFSDSEVFSIYGNKVLATDGYTFDTSSHNAQVHVKPGTVTLSQSIPDTEAIKQRMSQPVNMGMGGLDRQIENHSTNLSLVQDTSSPVRFSVAANTAIVIAVDVTFNNLANASVFSSDAVLSQAFGKTVTGASGGTTGTFSMAFSGQQDDSSAFMSSISSYVVDHLGQVTTFGNDHQGTHTLYARFENKTSSNVLVDFQVNLSTQTSFYTSFDPALVNAVPEPATWALLLAGLASVGVFARRRQAA